jgi:endonuclease VIII
MPEGHTLFALARDLHEAFAGTAPQVTSPQGKFAEGAAQLDGRQLLHATSRGKHLFVEFAGDHWLHVHLGLIGSFTVDEHAWTAEVPAVGQVRLRLRTDQHVADLRGPNLCEVATPERVDAVLAKLGPDPLRADADPDVAWTRISRSSRTIAELLMDQAVLAGVGNVYRCEVLFRHRLSPFTEGRNLRRASWRLIWDDLERLMPLGVTTGRIVTVEEQVVDVEAALGRGEVPRLTERSSYVYKRAGMPCLVCGSKVRTQLVAGRNLFWCGRCQRRR